jgi:hypothetical protein
MGTNEYVNAIAVSGSTVYAAGPFSVAGDCTSGCINIAKWDGSTWSPLGTGITTNYQAVYTVAVSGTTVYAGGGGFTSAGTCTSDAGCKFIAKYTPSSNADLSSLALSSGTLTPPFASAATAYTASVANNVTGLFVTPTAADAGAAIKIRVNGGIWSAVTSGSPSWVSPLNLGANAVNVQVTAEDGTTTKTYTVSVTRLTDTIAHRIYLPLVIH